MQEEDMLELHNIFKKQKKQEQKTESEFDTNHKVHNICLRIGHIFIFPSAKARISICVEEFYFVASVLLYLFLKKLLRCPSVEKMTSN